MIMDRRKKTWAYEQWCKGYTYPEIGEALGVGDRAISCYLGEAGLKKVKEKISYPMEARHLNDKQKEWIYDQWCFGHTKAELACATKMGIHTIEEVLRGKKKKRPLLTYDEEEWLR